jgi:hypothetical protein
MPTNMYEFRRDDHEDDSLTAVGAVAIECAARVGRRRNRGR